MGEDGSLPQTINLSNCSLSYFKMKITPDMGAWYRPQADIYKYTKKIFKKQACNITAPYFLNHYLSLCLPFLPEAS